MKIIDTFLNKTPMYRVVIYSLLSIVIVAFAESFFGLLSFTPISLGESLGICLIICVLVNFLFAKSLKLPLQYDSSIITALILFLILMPVMDISSLLAAIIAATLATASKYILTYKNTHIFNPAAFGLFSITFLGYFASSMNSAFWWVGSFYLLPIVLIAGLIVVRKTRHENLFFAGIIAYLFGSIFTAYFFQTNILTIWNGIFISGPAIFFLTIMITEPHTFVKTKIQQYFYVSLIVLLPVLFSVTNIFNIPPELSLLIANLVSLIIAGRSRVILKLKSITKLSEDMFEYNFAAADPRGSRSSQTPGGQQQVFHFRAGEFMEWTLMHKGADSRSIRRYFTISSAPNTSELSFATKFPTGNESSFKKALQNIQIGDTVYATQLHGEFVLPNLNLIAKDKNLILIAGGIGITPFISQIRDLLNKKEKRSIVLFYCVKFTTDIVYMDLLKKAIDELGAKIVCVVSDADPRGSDATTLTPGGQHANLFYETGYMSKEILQKYTQNLHNQYFISGPNMMVDMLKKILKGADVKRKDIHTDYFPGF